MRFIWFNLMPWPHLPEDFREKYGRSGSTSERALRPGARARGLQRLPRRARIRRELGFDGSASTSTTRTPTG